jgi:hypothetical protein
MSLMHRLGKELRVVAATTLYFAIWFGILVLLKRLYLADYEVKFRGLSLALISALLVGKVVLLLEHITLGQWVSKHAVGIDVILRTLLYTFGVWVAVLLERGFEARHEHGGLGGGVAWVWQHRDMHHVWADTIAVGAALLVFNALSAVRRHLGEGRLHRVFLEPPADVAKGEEHSPAEPEVRNPPSEVRGP